MRSSSFRVWWLAGLWIGSIGMTDVGGAIYYVATNGNDNASGSFSAPWRTIQKAANTMVAGDICYVRGGVYRESIVPLNSGTVGAPITYAAYSNETVIISGTEIISNWTHHAGNIYKAPMASNFFNSAYNQANQIFVDGEMMTLAKWPNTTTSPKAYPSGTIPPVDIMHPAKSILTSPSQPRVFDNSTGTNWYYITFTDTNLWPKATNYYVGAEIYMQPHNNGWSWTQTGEIVAHTNATLTMRTPSSAGPDIFPNGSRYYLFNKLEMLDAPGEWYHDKQAGLLYLWTPTGNHPSNHVVEARARDYAFDLSNRSNIVIRGFHLFACSITTDNLAGGANNPAFMNRGYNGTNGVVFPWRVNNSFASANRITIDGINAKYIWHYTDVSGHFYMQWGYSSGITLGGEDNVLSNSVIQYSAGNGVSVPGKRNRVINNVIMDCNYMSTDQAFISTGGGIQYDIEIASNVCLRAGRSGITIRGLKNSNPSNIVARVHHNDVGYCMIQDWDGGSIYNAGEDAQFVRIDHNRFHDNSNYSGIYIDWCRNYIVDHNVVWNTDYGVQIQASIAGPGGSPSGTNNVICYNNTLSAYRIGIHNGIGPSHGTVLQNNLIINQTNAANFVAISTNAFTGSIISHNHTWDGVPNSPTDPKFVNVASNDYRLLPGSLAINAGTVIPTYVRDGIAVAPFNEAPDGKPDLGAHEMPGLTMLSAIASVVTGNTNAWFDPGETIQELVVMSNGGSIPFTNVTATLSTTNAGVTILVGASPYPNIPGGAQATNSTPFQYRLAKTIPCGTVLTFTHITAGNGELYTNTFTRTVGQTGLGGLVTNTIFSTDVPKAIPDTSTIFSTNNVTGLSGTLQDVNVAVRIDHTWVGDLIIAIRHPDNTEVILVQQRGGAGDNFGSTSGTTTNYTVFDQQAAQHISSGSAPFVGSFRPEVSLTNLNGKTPNGIWRLRIQDTAGGDVGTLHRWYLQLTTQAQTCQVQPYNNPPVASNRTHCIAANLATNLVLTASDVDNDPITFLTNSLPTHGVLSGFNPTTGAFTYTPNSGYIGNDSFTFRVTDGAATSSLATVTLKVGGAPVILAHPQSQIVMVGSNVTFSVSATGIGLTYQWQRNGTNLVGATTASLTVSNVTLADSGAVFACVVSADCPPTVTSSNAVLSVYGPFPYWQITHFGVTNGIAAPTADPDNDGVVNLLEYAFDRNPNVAETNRLVDFAVTTVTGTDYLHIIYRRRKPPHELAYAPQAGNTLTNWPWSVTEIATNHYNATLDEIIARVNVPVGSEPVVHGRLAVTLAPYTKVAEVFSVARRILVPGRNYLGPVGEPVTNTLSALLPTNRFAGADTEAGATVVDFWSQTAQTLTNRAWLSSLPAYPGWRDAGTFADANQRLVDVQKGFIVTVREGHGARTNYLAGYLPRVAQVQTVQNNGYTVVSTRWPMAVTLEQSGLVPSGFVGGSSQVTSDVVLFFNPTTQLFDTKVWYDAVSQVWRDQTAAVATQRLEAGTAVLIQRRNRANHLIWTNPVPYSVTEVWP